MMSTAYTQAQNQSPVMGALVQSGKPVPYKAHIDGLRALAVLAVIAYHYGSGTFPGGFIGVDVFFVISGYLITGILTQAMEGRTFSLLYFYQRRVQRIFPALILVLAFCLVAGWLLLFPTEYEQLAKHVAGGAGFVENFVLWSEAGYFDAHAILKPLLHLWSLAVEEQFYIFWPLILWFVLRRRWPLMAAIILIASLSFALNMYSVWQNHSTAAFYSPATRAWELMVGAWLAIGNRRGLPWLSKYASAQSWIGLCLIVLGFAVIHPNYQYPGQWALLPVLGTALLINAGSGAFLNRHLLSSRPAVWIGLISYPLYLWHWVLFSLAIVVFGEYGTWGMRGIEVAAAALSFMLAWATYRWLEQPVRRGGHAIPVVVVMALLGLGGLGVYAFGGLPSRPYELYEDDAIHYLASIKQSPLSNECFNLKNGTELATRWYCELGDTTSNVWIMAYGDSHAASMIPALDRYGEVAGIRIVFAGMTGCLALLGIQQDGQYAACTTMARNAAQLARSQHASAVILIHRWAYYVGKITRANEAPLIRTIRHDDAVTRKPLAVRDTLKYGLATTLVFYQAFDIPVLLLEDNPRQPLLGLKGKLRFDVSKQALRAAAATLSQYRRDNAQVNQVIEMIEAQYPAASVLNIAKPLCGPRICPWMQDGKLLYFDDDHLSVAGSMLVYPLLAEQLNQVLGQRGRERLTQR